MIDTRTGDEEQYPLQERAITFDFNRSGKLEQVTAGVGLRIEPTSRNVFVSDQGAKERARLADRDLPLQTAWVWQPNQEVRVGPYLLLLRPSQPWLQQRMTALTSEQVSPLVSVIVIVVLAGSLLLLGIRLFLRQGDALQSTAMATLRNTRLTAAQAPPYAVGLPMPSAITPTPAATATDLPTITPTPVLTVTVADKPPTATPTPTATESITEAIKRLGAGTVVNETPVIDAHKLKPSPGRWDTRLDQLGVVYQPALVPIGGQFWRLIDAQWLDEKSASGFHHVFVEVLDENDARVLEPVTMSMAWTTGNCTQFMQNTPPLQIGAQQLRPYGMNCPMFSAGSVYRVKVNGFGLPSDEVLNLGLGLPDPEYRTWAIPTTFLFIFQRTMRLE
ncbi:MAG: hypothetical protein R3E79_14790 [Caldilineaceae bacterium]